MTLHKIKVQRWRFFVHPPRDRDWIIAPLNRELWTDLTLILNAINESIAFHELNEQLQSEDFLLANGNNYDVIVGSPSSHS